MSSLRTGTWLCSFLFSAASPLPTTDTGLYCLAVVGICVWNFLMQKEENGILPGGLREEVSMITVHAYIRGK